MNRIVVVVLLVVAWCAEACAVPGGARASAPKPGLRLVGDAGKRAEVASQDAGGTGWVAGGLATVAPEPGTGARDQSLPTSGAAGERLLVQRGEIRVEVARPEDAVREFVARVRAWGGYLQRQDGTAVTVRVPAATFDEAIAAVRAVGRVLGESRQADDVTEEFVDLGIRLDTARKARDRLLEVLARAEKVEDVLKVEAELRRLTEEIERMEGRRKFLGDQVAMATLIATFQGTSDAPAGPKSRQWSRFGWVNRVGAETLTEDF